MRKKAHTISILLVKAAITADRDVVDSTDCNDPIEIPIDGLGVGQLYIKKSHPVPPRWAQLFNEFLDVKSLAVPRVSGVLVVRSARRVFAITFGPSGRFLIRSDVCEERFGLLCALNAVDPSSFRCVDVQSLDAIQSHSRIQASEATSPDQFGLDVEQDMLKAVVGKPKNPLLGGRMTGSDALSVSVRMTLSDLPFLLEEYLRLFEAELSAEDHQWVNNISLVRKDDIATELEIELAARLNSNDTSQIWMSIPEIIDWTSVVGFMHSHGGREVFPDVTLAGFLKTLDASESVTPELLRKRLVHCADAEHQKVYRSWSVLRCLYAEINRDGHKYILNDGKWFRVDMDFVARTDTAFAKIEVASIEFPAYSGGGEGLYNRSVSVAQPEKFALLDQDTVQHGGGHGRIEVCDLLSVDRELIHIKLYGKSSVLSHLFSQGFVSGELLQIDAGLRDKVKKKLHPPFDALIEGGRRPAQDGFSIVYAVISTEPGPGLHLPFFSRVNLNNVKKVLEGFGYEVRLLKIAVDENFAKTSMLPPRRKRAPP